jgi:hypothetical protein
MLARISGCSWQGGSKRKRLLEGRFGRTSTEHFAAASASFSIGRARPDIVGIFEWSEGVSTGGQCWLNVGVDGD